MSTRLSARDTGGRELMEAAKIHKTPIVTGILYRRGFFNDWRKRYVELYDDEIVVSMIKGGMGYITFKFGVKTRCTESSIKHYCFILTNPDGESLTFAAENIASKETWTEAIQADLSKIRLANRKARCLLQSDGHRATNNLSIYQQRPQVFIKIIRARNLTAKDSNGYSDPYVKLSMGNSTARTTTRKMDLNPEWGMVFPFDWDRTMRYARVEVWDEDDISSDDFLGSVLIPLYTMRDGDALQQWYPLGRRSSKSHVSGEIEIEIACTGQPDRDQNTWHLFHAIQSMPELTLNLASKVDGSGQIALRYLFEGTVGNDSNNATAPESRNPSPFPSQVDAATPTAATAMSALSMTEEQNEVLLLDKTDTSAAVNYIALDASNEAEPTTPEPTQQQYNGITETPNNVVSPASAAAALKGFPLHFPPIELEVLEDVSLRVSILCVVNASKVTAPGVLFITNFRLIFVSLASICKRRDTGESQFTAVPCGSGSANTPLDLTTHIPLSSIMSATLTTENEGVGYGPLNATYDAVRLRLTDSRTVSFMFRDDVDALSNFKDPAKVIINRAIDLISVGENAIANLHRDISVDSSLASTRNKNGSIVDNATFGDIYANNHDFDRGSTSSLASTAASVGASSVNSASTKNEITAKLRGHAQKKMSAYNYYTHREEVTETLSPAETALLAACKEPSAIVEASDSAEGPPAHRMYMRLKLVCCNRWSQRANALTIHQPLLNALARACGQAPSANESDVRMTSTLPQSPQSFRQSTRDVAIFVEQPQQDEDRDSVINPAHLPMGWISNAAASNEPLIPLTEREQLQRECTVRGLERKVKRHDELVRTATKLLVNLENSWDRFVPLAEFKRMGIPNKYWRITDANRDYALCPTYPSILAVPECIQDTELAEAAQFRSKGRVPALSWHSLKNNCTISRCSQPMVGLSNSRCPEDETILRAANRAAQFKGDHSLESGTPKEVTPLPRALVKPYIIVDARPLLNAKANQAAGKGVESDKVYENVSVVFMDIANIHAVRKSLEILEEACADEASWARNLESSGWLGHIRKILLASGRIAHCVAHENLSVLVHCSDGWDRTSQLTSLSMLMLDEHYRTLDGFIVLIEKEWLSFGHKFGDRLGYTVDGWKDEERSPIFAQFLDCVHQCVAQMPNAFEFNEVLLLFLMEHINSGWFGNFFFNTENEMKYYSAQGGLISIWAAVLGNRERYLNRGYYAHDSPIIPVVTKSRLVLWSSWFLRWQDNVWSLAWTDTNQVDLKKLPGSTSGAWVEDKAVTICKCGRTFSCIRRKHHCRCCGNVFCEACSRGLRVIPSVSTWRPSRCCDECARLIDISESENFMSMSPLTSQLTSSGVRESEDTVELSGK